MSRKIYARQAKRFWRNFGMLGIVLLVFGILLGVFGVDVYRQSDVTDGIIVGVNSAGQFVSGRAGETFVDGTRRLVDYRVRGSTWTMSIVEGSVGDSVQVRYYRRWPRIAWLGSRFNRFLGFGVVIAVVGAICLVSKRVWGGA